VINITRDIITLMIRVGGPIRPGPKDRVGHWILARKRLSCRPIKMRPEKMTRTSVRLGNPNPTNVTFGAV